MRQKHKEDEEKAGRRHTRAMHNRQTDKDLYIQVQVTKSPGETNRGGADHHSGGERTKRAV